MKFVVDLAPEAYERIARAIMSEEPALIVRFIRLAIENQLALEESEEGSYENALEGGSGADRRTEVNLARQEDLWKGLRIDDIPWQGLTPVAPPRIAEGPLWGQYNRLLPAKVGLRVLTQALSSSPDGISLEDYHRKATNVGVKARRFLTDIDAFQGIPRGERLSTAFPEATEKSIHRFQSHFLGYLQRDGSAVGALPELGFITISPEAPNGVQMTDIGLAFVRLPNPVMEGDSIPRKTMSPAEVQFLLNHFRSFMDGEFRFIKGLLQWISQGMDSPETLTRQVQREYPEWSRKVASTMRAGALGRMQELNLISRLREGRQITYCVENAGLELLEEDAE
ncbi:MAG: hypothetical protein ACE5IJ_05275 [Thermoplasmata archaeon]